MKRLVTYRDMGTPRAGVEIDGAIFDIEATGWSFDGEPPTILSILERGLSAPSAVFELAERARDRGDIPAVATDLADLAPPIMNPRKIFCLGVNYPGHIEEAGMSLPEYPVVFAKWVNALSGPRDPIVVNGASEMVDWEGELVAVIGRRCRAAAADDALANVAGYCVFNDVSARDIQLRGGQWSLGKSLDGFGPLGPGITPLDLIKDPTGLDMTTRLNGDVVQKDNTRSMVFGVPEAIAYISSFITLEPGDLIATGTPAGVGVYLTPQRFLTEGDVIEVEIEGLGTISNAVVSANVSAPR